MSRTRAEAVKWLLVDAGIAGDRIETRVGAIGKGFELTLVIAAQQ